MEDNKPSTQMPPAHQRSLAERPQFRRASALQASVAPSAPPIALSRISNDLSQPEHSLSPPVEEAFIFQIPLVASRHPDIRYGRKQISAEGICRPGWSYLLDMSAAPTRRLDTTFDNALLYMHQNTLDELAHEKGLRSVGSIAQPAFGTSDPIMFHLAQAWLPILESPALASSLFIDHLALCLHEHVITTYSGARSSHLLRKAALAPWQMRRITEFVEANLGGNPSIIELARECELSSSYFAEAFRQTTGVSPHHWLLKRRVERAKVLLLSKESTLASIASDCGFFDQSHLSRVFKRFENCGPGEWRRYHLSR